MYENAEEKLPPGQAYRFAIPQLPRDGMMEDLALIFPKRGPSGTNPIGTSDQELWDGRALIPMPWSLEHYHVWLEWVYNSCEMALAERGYKLSWHLGGFTPKHIQLQENACIRASDEKYTAMDFQFGFRYQNRETVDGVRAALQNGELLLEPGAALVAITLMTMRHPGPQWPILMECPGALHSARQNGKFDDCPAWHVHPPTHQCYGLVACNWNWTQHRPRDLQGVGTGVIITP